MGIERLIKNKNINDNNMSDDLIKKTQKSLLLAKSCWEERYVNLQVDAIEY